MRIEQVEKFLAHSVSKMLVEVDGARISEFVDRNPGYNRPSELVGGGSGVSTATGGEATFNVGKHRLKIQDMRTGRDGVDYARGKIYIDDEPIEEIVDESVTYPLEVNRDGMTSTVKVKFTHTSED